MKGPLNTSYLLSLGQREGSHLPSGSEPHEIIQVPSSNRQHYY